MVRYGVQALIDRQAQTSDASTFKYDLPKKGGLAGMDVILRETNGGTSNLDHWLTEIVSKLEIIANGDQRLFSMTGEEAFRYFWLRDGKPPECNFDEGVSAVQRCNFPLQFGRFPNDPLYGLDLGKYENVQLAIEYNAATGGAVGATGYLTGSFEVSAQMHITEAQRAPSYRGCITPREIYNFTTVASGEKEVDLPTQWPILGYMIYAREEAVAFATSLTKARLSLDNDAMQPYRGRIEHQVAWQKSRMCPATIKYPLLVNSTGTKHVHFDDDYSVLFDILGIDWATGATDGIENTVHASPSADTITLQGMKVTYAKAGVVQSAIAALALAPADMNVTGYPGHCLYVPIADREAMTDLLNPRDYSNAKLILEQGNAGAYCGIIIEELRT